MRHNDCTVFGSKRQLCAGTSAQCTGSANSRLGGLVTSKLLALFKLAFCQGHAAAVERLLGDLTARATDCAGAFPVCLTDVEVAQSLGKL